MVLVALMSFYGAMGFMAVAIVIACFLDRCDMSSRGRRAISTGTLLATGFLAVWVLAKTVGPAHIIVALPLLVTTVIYLFGYLAPVKLRAPVESRVKQYLNFLDFTAPAGLLPWIRRARLSLCWLGLSVD